MKKVKEFIGYENKEEHVESNTAEEDDSSYRARQAGLQTVQTSMRGLLDQTDEAPKRKKLLGE